VKQYEITSGFLERKRKLVLANEYIEFENGDFKGHEFTKLNKDNIADFKHGVDWIVWYEFTVGRLFSVTFRDNQNKELKISFNSYFRLHPQNDQLYSDIVDDVWKYYHSDIVYAFLEKIYNGEELLLQGLKISNGGIQLRGHESKLPWEKVAIKDYSGYFAIFDKNNPASNSTISYNEYGTETLWSAVRTILNEKGLSTQ
jgi:hypothetical protein